MDDRTNLKHNLCENIRSVITYMYENYNQKIAVGELAARCNLSMYRFIHKFKAATGMTPIEYLPKSALVKPNICFQLQLNISEIAAIVGYDDPLYFSRVFKKETGLSTIL